MGSKALGDCLQPIKLHIFSIIQINRTKYFTILCSDNTIGYSYKTCFANAMPGKRIKPQQKQIHCGYPFYK